MTLPSSINHMNEERKLVGLAREIAIDIRDIETILKSYGISRNEFETIQANARFKAILTSQVQAWEAAENVEARTKLKMAAIVEETLPTIYTRLHEAGEWTAAKTELLKTVMKGAGVGMAEAGPGAEKVSITINMGAEKQVTVQAALPSQVIDGEYAEL